MVVLAAKVTLARKEEVAIPLTDLHIRLSWTQEVDLDLMVFYRKQDGSNGGILSEHYPQGNQGVAGQFPYITLDDDAGVGATGGDHDENITISQIDPSIVEYYIVTINYTDCIGGKQSTFSEYDGGVVVKGNEGGEEKSVAVRLDATERGHVALIARIDNTTGTPKLVNENRIMTLATFAADIPGATLVTS